MVVNRAGLKVVLGHPERFFYLEEPVIRADHELRGHGGPVGAGGEVGDVPLIPARVLARASSSRSTLLAAPSRAMNRFRLTGARSANRCLVPAVLSAEAEY